VPLAGASLRIEAGSALGPKTNEYAKFGLPYGEMPRLVLIDLAASHHLQRRSEKRK
jgi:hypothetical protein